MAYVDERVRPPATPHSPSPPPRRSRWNGVPVLGRLRESIRATDEEGERRAARDHAEREDGAYSPPRSPEDDTALVLGLKVGIAMLLADMIARGIGFPSPTWSVLTAAFLATSPPIASANAAVKKIVAMLVGITLGVAGAYAAQAMSAVPSLHFLVVGLVAGFLGSRSADYLFAAVVGTVVTFVGSGGGDPTAEVATRTVCMILIGCAVGPVVVWAVERVRRAAHERKWAN